MVQGSTKNQFMDISILILIFSDFQTQLQAFFPSLNFLKNQ